MTELRVFSPTRTDTWDRCQLLDEIQNHNHWVPKQATRQLVGALCGRAFAIGVACLSKGTTVDEAVARATGYLRDDIQHYVDHGVTFEVTVEELIGASEVAWSLAKYAKEQPLKGWTIKHIEHTLPEHGGCIIDLGGLDTDGIVSVLDFKYKRNLEARYEQSTIDEYLTSWQFQHYPWAYGEHLGVPCYRMYLCLVVAKPRFYIKLVPHEIHPETQQIWLTSARAKWARMAQEDAIPEMSSRHKDQFGLCPYYRACFDYHLDEGLMKQEYVQVPRRLTGGLNV